MLAVFLLLSGGFCAALVLLAAVLLGLKPLTPCRGGFGDVRTSACSSSCAAAKHLSFLTQAVLGSRSRDKSSLLALVSVVLRAVGGVSHGCPCPTGVSL